MGRLAGHLTLLGGIILLFNLFGLASETSLVSFLLHPENYTNSAIYLKLLTIIGVFTVVAGVSYFVGGSDKMDFIAFAPMILLFLGFLNELLAIFNAVAVGGVGARIFGALVLSPLFIILIMSVMEWWRGTST